MAKYKITMINNGIGTVVIYREKDDVKAMYDEAIAGAIFIFGPEGESKPYAVIVEELPI